MTTSGGMCFVLFISYMCCVYIVRIYTSIHTAGMYAERVDEFMHRQNNFMQIFNDGNYSDNV